MTGLLAGYRIGLLTASASRLGGGVAEAVIAQAAMIRSLGGEAAIFALADSFGDDDRVRYEPSHVWFNRIVGPAQIGFAPGLIDRLVAADLDCLHLHGIWMYPSRAGALWARRSGKPYVVSPHGMLDPWITARGRIKKAIARTGYERASWARAAALHALTSREAKDIARESGRLDSLVIPNAGPQAQPLPHRPRPLHFVYIGRIHPKKNLLALVQAWTMLAPRGQTKLTIAGWGDAVDEAALRSALRDAPPSVEFIGPVYGEAKQRLIQSARFTVLPSHSEGLPISVLEGWAAAVPAIMTGECNLPEGFAAGAAIECGYEADSIAQILSTALGQSDHDWLVMARAARHLAVQRFSSESVASQWASAYMSLIATRKESA